MGKLEDIKQQLAEIGNDLTEIDGDVQEVLDKLAGSTDGLTADEVTEVIGLLSSLKERTRATADKVPEPPTT